MAHSSSALESSSSSSSSSTSPSLDSKDEVVLLLRSRIDRLESIINERFYEDDDPEITPQAALQYYRPVQYDIDRCPSIKPERPVEFFTKQRISDTALKEAIHNFPKNVYMDKYTAPKVPHLVSSNIKFNKKHDSQIHEVQEQCAELTRPVDFFFHKFRKLQRVDPLLLDPKEILEIAVNFAILMREHLGGMAVKMQETRMATFAERDHRS